MMKHENYETMSSSPSSNNRDLPNDMYITPSPHAPNGIHNGDVSGGAIGGVEEKEKRTRSRKWSDEEVDLFLKILGDPRYMFAASLENLVPKKRSNYELFTNIRNVYRRELKERHRNRLPGFEYSMSLDLSIEKLRKKYSNLKVEWRRMSTDRVRKAEVMDHFPEPRWYRSVQKLMTDIKIESEKVNKMTLSVSNSQICEPKDRASPRSPNEMSDHIEPRSQHEGRFSNHVDELEEPTFVVISNRSTIGHHENHSPLYSNNSNSLSHNGSSQHVREYPFKHPSSSYSSRDREPDFHARDETTRSLDRHSPALFNNGNGSYPVNSTTRPNSSDVTDFQYPYKRQRMSYYDSAPTPPHGSPAPALVDSNKSVVSLADGLKQLAELQMKRQRMIIEADFKTYDLFLRHKEQETEKNRAHEIQLAEIYAKALTGVVAHYASVEPPLKRSRSTQEEYNNSTHPHLTEQAVYKTLTEVEHEMVSPPSFTSSHSGGSSFRGDQ